MVSPVDNMIILYHTALAYLRVRHFMRLYSFCCFILRMQNYNYFQFSKKIIQKVPTIFSGVCHPAI